MRDVLGKFAMVTGSGIGFGMATALAPAGMHVVLADLRPAALESARGRCGGNARDVIAAA
jgi:NADP-dependent 3-hydroxy acid dehydrogenase YdfG